MARICCSLVLFAASFGYVEAALVTYLRAIYDPIHQELYAESSPSDLFPLIRLDQLRAAGPEHLRRLVTELAREAATLVMLCAVGLAAGSKPRSWFAGFMIAFGTWDVFYYVFLVVLLGWPSSIMDLDLLFLVPVPWVAPVLAPVLVSCGMIFAGSVMLSREFRGRPMRFSWLHGAAICGGGLVIMASFCWDSPRTMAGAVPGPFNWPLFGLGFCTAALAFLHAFQTVLNRAGGQRGCTGIISSQQWCEYFRANSMSLMEIPWQCGVVLSDCERAALAASVQGFQLGESSEGRHLIRCAQRHAELTGDYAYVDAIRGLIAEEQRHARDLGRFLTQAGVPLIKHTWPDTVFRWLRHGAGLELSVSVLITAEVVAKVYYAALREATQCEVLRRLCDQILRDEIEHVRFQAQRLAMLRSERSAVWLLLTRLMHRGFMFGTSGVVWWKHGRAMRAGGFGLRRFWHELWRETNETLDLMDPRSYTALNGWVANQRDPEPEVRGLITLERGTVKR